MQEIRNTSWPFISYRQLKPDITAHFYNFRLYFHAVRLFSAPSSSLSSWLPSCLYRCMGGDASGGDNNSSIRCTPHKQSPPLQRSPSLALVVEEEGSSSSSSRGREFSESPILLLVLLHKSVRAELAELRRVVADAGEKGVWDRELLVDLRRRFDFLKRVYMNHCAAEDEVIFLTLDNHVKNVTCTYSLEHKSIDDLFESIFCCLNILSEDHETRSEEFQELIFCVGTLREIIDKHMQKEEKQVFPLLMEAFSDAEQASLVWKFLCGVPVMLLEDLFPWLTEFISSEELEYLKCCLRKVVPDDNLLQKVIISWLENKTQKSSRVCFGYGKLVNHVLRKSHQQKEEDCSQAKGCLVDGFQLWHAAIKLDLKKTIEQLSEMRSKSNISNMVPVIVQIKFLVDVLIFYGNALDEIFYPVLEELAILQLPLLGQTCHFRSEVEALQNILYSDSYANGPLPSFVEKLCNKLESLLIVISEHSSYQEAKVIPVICKNCGQETQQKLLFMSLHMMPLGLLKCVITWFSSHLPSDKWRSILHIIKQARFLETSFASLLHEWVRISYSGKTSMEEVQEMFNSRTSYSSKKNKHNLEPCRHFDPVTVKDCSTNNNGACHFDSTCHFLVNENLSLPGSVSENNAEVVSVHSLEPKPLDLIYYFHKAMKKDLEYLVLCSSKLAGNFGIVMEFQRRFRLTQTLYQIHSDAEDQIAFPALEAKQNVQNISHSYSIDHKLEADCFEHISYILSKMCKLHQTHSSASWSGDSEYCKLCLELQDSCRSLQKLLGDHVNHEEIEIWPKFKECFSIGEQEKIIGCMLGRLGAETLLEMIPWLLSFLTPEEQHALMSFWCKAAEQTRFNEWLSEWWEGLGRSDTSQVRNTYDSVKVTEESADSPSRVTENLQILAKYLNLHDFSSGGEMSHDDNVKYLYSCSDVNDLNNDEGLNVYHEEYKYSECAKLSSEKEGKQMKEAGVTDLVRAQVASKFWHQKNLLTMNQGEKEAVIRKVSSDSSLDIQMKSQIIQNLLMSPWIIAEQQPDLKKASLSGDGELPGQFPSYRDSEKSTFGCKHYKQNCKLVASCCNQLFTCRHCHDDEVGINHQMNGRSSTQMMCMKCLKIQPIGQACSTASCKGFSMAKYYCRICKLFDDERQIYHCPYCNLCRVGKGLGIDFFHCMKCNACMALSLSVHLCRENYLDDKCPICHEDFFTSTSTIKTLPCSHLMHSHCFQEYTRIHYICPICSKSLGDMQVYFSMLDALLAEETKPEEYRDQTQAILCNDCEKRGFAPFHWLYHKCPFCGSYNTRPL